MFAKIVKKSKQGRFLLFCLGISLFFEQIDDFFLEFSLNKNFAIFHAPAHATFCFQQAAQLFHVLVGADEIFHNGNGLAAAVVLFYAHAQLLLLLGEGVNFLLFIGDILEIRVG